MNKFTKSARDIPLAQKENTFQKCFPIINTMHVLSSDNMMLRSQLRLLVSAAYRINEKNTDFMISEMMNSGLLYRKNICTGSKTDVNGR